MRHFHRSIRYATVLFSITLMIIFGCSSTYLPSILVRSSKEVPNDSFEDRTACQASGNVIQSSSFINADDLIPVEVEISNCKYVFAIDTGASISVYDNCFLNLLGDPVRFETRYSILSKSKIPIYKSIGGKVGSLQLDKNQDACCMDLSRLRSATNPRISGILGMDFLKKHILKIDFDSNRLYFLKQIENNSGHKIDVEYIKNTPYIHVRVSGMRDEGLFQVDLGGMGFYGSLQSSAFQFLLKQGFMKKTESESLESADGPATVSCGTLNDISIGVYSHKQLDFFEAKQNTIGLKFWSQYNVTFDFPHNAIYLQKRGRK